MQPPQDTYSLPHVGHAGPAAFGEREFKHMRRHRPRVPDPRAGTPPPLPAALTQSSQSSQRNAKTVRPLGPEALLPLAFSVSAPQAMPSPDMLQPARAPYDFTSKQSDAKSHGAEGMFSPTSFSPGGFTGPRTAGPAESRSGPVARIHCPSVHLSLQASNRRTFRSPSPS